MWDVAGTGYIDASSGPMVSAIGHGNNEVIDAMAGQARNARNSCAARMPQ